MSVSIFPRPRRLHFCPMRIHISAQGRGGGVRRRTSTYVERTWTYVDARRRTFTYIERTWTYVDVRRRTPTYVDQIFRVNFNLLSFARECRIHVWNHVMKAAYACKYPVVDDCRRMSKIVDGCQLSIRRRPLTTYRACLSIKCILMGAY